MTNQHPDHPTTFQDRVRALTGDIMRALGLTVHRAGIHPDTITIAGLVVTLLASICNYGLIPGELTGQLTAGLGFPMGEGLLCVIDPGPQVANVVTSMFFDVGVYLVVVGLLLDLLRSLGSGVDRHILRDEEAALAEREVAL